MKYIFIDMRTALNRENCLMECIVDDTKQLDLSDYGLTDFNFGTRVMGIIRPNEECRPDLISLRVYGTVDLWWFVMWYNGFSDPWHDLKADTAFYYMTGERVKDAIRQVKDKLARGK